MQWAQQHRQKIDPNFVILLGKMAEYARNTDKIEVGKALDFLKTCFAKMFDFSEERYNAITRENFRQVWEEATGYLKRGEVQKALQLLESLSLFQSQHPDIQCRPLLYVNMGIAYAQMKQTESAIQHLRLALAENLPRDAREKALVNLGIVYLDARDFLPALDCYRSALEIATERRDPVMQISYLNSVALICIEQKKLAEATDYQQKACELAKGTDDKRLMQDSLTRLALLMNLKGDYKKCEELCREALALF